MLKKIAITAAILSATLLIAINVLAWRHVHSLLHFSGSKVAWASSERSERPAQDAWASSERSERPAKPENLSFGSKIKILFSGIDNPRPKGTKTPTDFGLPFEKVLISGTNRVTLSGWYIPGVKPGPCVLMFHGYIADKSSLLEEANVFHRMGLPVWLMDFRGSGDSSESYTTIGHDEAEDVAVVFQAVKKKSPGSKIILFGHSMGAAAILRAADHFQIKPDLIILESVFDTMRNTVGNRFKILGLSPSPFTEILLFWGGVQMGFNPFANNPADFARAVSCPALFFHGERDTRARLSEGSNVFRAIPGSNKRFVSFSDVGHEPMVSLHPETWKKVILEEINGL